ncbi:MAG: hypothetical protein EBY26_05165, partial [Microbacteriaceae bacterium]|nr:hypothetical protein [Microbacteriaceae bacterium]
MTVVDLTPTAATFAENSSSGGVCVVDGIAVSMHVDRGHLVISDGVGQHRRERRFHKATHGLSRIVILTADGSLSLKALRYCRDLGITVVTIDPRTHTPTFANIARTNDDARMRRIQAAAPELPVGVDITRMVLSAKLRGQASNLRTYFGDEVAADTIDSLADAITIANDVARMIALEASAAACYFSAWTGHKAAAARFS